MALADKVKGLSRHRIEVPPAAPAATEAFDIVRADQLLRGINGELNSSYPVGCIEWISAHRQDVWNSLCAGENAVDTAYLANDMPNLVKSIDLLRRMYLKAYELFATRPPVIEVQADLGL